METLRIASMMAENAEFVVAAVVRFFDDRLHIRTQLVNDVPWQERQELLDAGEVQIAWICGLPYVRRADEPDPTIELLAAPVMEGERYDERPIYFSDIVVRRDSRLRTFEDLRGASWAYNEPGSHSGYNVVRYHLATLGETWNYFERVVESGAHQRSLQMILDGDIDASAIDSTVLEIEFERDPTLRSRVRIIEALGPSPIPPWVVSKSVPQERRENLRELLISMDEDPHGQEILMEIPVARFVRVEDGDYDAIRRMAREGADVSL